MPATIRLDIVSAERELFSGEGGAAAAALGCRNVQEQGALPRGGAGNQAQEG